MVNVCLCSVMYVSIGTMMIAFITISSLVPLNGEPMQLGFDYGVQCMS